MASTSFESLTQELTQDEKKRLLEEIRKSLNLDQKDTDQIQSSSNSRDEIRKIALKEMEKLGFWSKFFLNLHSLFTGASKPDLFLKKKLGILRKDIQNHGLTNFDYGTFTEDVAKSFYDLYFYSYEISPAFEWFFGNPKSAEQSVSALLGKDTNEIKKTIYDFVDWKNFEDIYIKTGSKNLMHKALRDSLQHYLRTIKPAVFDEISQKILPLYYLKSLVLFPYNLVFEEFHYSLDREDSPHKYPVFGEAKFLTVLEFMERIHYALAMTQKLVWQPGMFDFVFQGIPKINLELFNKSLDDLLRVLKNFTRNIPLEKIICFIKEDPYYNFRLTPPQFDLITYYKNSMLMSLSQQLDQEFPDIRKKIVDSQKNNLFQNQNSQLLESYKYQTNPVLDQIGLPRFKFVDSLNLTYTFLSTYFPQHFGPLIQMLLRTVLSPFKNLMNNLQTLGTELESCRARIYAFDKSFSIETEEGRNFQKIRNELEKKVSSQNQYISYLQKKDMDARDLIVQSRGHLEKLREFFNQSVQNIALKPLLKAPYLGGGGKQSISQTITDKRDMLIQLLGLLKDFFDFESKS